MRVGLDARMALNSGIGTTIRHLIEQWTPPQRNQVVLWAQSGWTNPYGMAQQPATDPIYSLRQHWRYARALNRAPMDLFHMPHFDVPMGYRGKLVVTIHDLIPYLMPEYSTKPFTKFYSRALLSYVARRANRIICVSASTKNDLVKLFPRVAERVRVVSPAVDIPSTFPSEAVERDALAAHRLQPGYILYVGNLRKSKNTPGLIAAYEMLKARRPDAPPLVLAGHNSLSSLTALTLPPGVRMLGAVRSDHLPVLYRNALFFCFPSFYEGFGLPPLEAMAHGAPVIASHRASLPDVCGDAALYVDPTSPDDIAAKMTELILKPELRERLKKAGARNIQRFSWKTFADETWRIYEEVAAEKPR
jgi:glycosyltransferase involved in cell wall biosynthesis